MVNVLNSVKDGIENDFTKLYDLYKFAKALLSIKIKGQNND